MLSMVEVTFLESDFFLKCLRESERFLEMKKFFHE